MFFLFNIQKLFIHLSVPLSIVYKSPLPSSPPLPDCDGFAGAGPQGGHLGLLLSLAEPGAVGECITDFKNTVSKRPFRFIQMSSFPCGNYPVVLPAVHFLSSFPLRSNLVLDRKLQLVKVLTNTSSRPCTLMPSFQRPNQTSTDLDEACEAFLVKMGDFADFEVRGVGGLCGQVCATGWIISQYCLLLVVPFDYFSWQ